MAGRLMTAIAIGLVAATGVAAPSGAGEEPARGLGPGDSHRAAVERCSTRSEASFPNAFTADRNLVVGPLAMMGAGRPHVHYHAGFGGQKFQLLVRNGHRVTIELPRKTRRTAGLAYGRLPGGQAELADTHRAVSFISCRRGHESGSDADGDPVTFWSGGVLAASPQCVPLRVFVDDEPVPRRAVIHLGVRSCNSASGPPLRVAQAELDAALKCPIPPANSTQTPIMFVTGTGASGDTAWLMMADAFAALGHPVCYVNFPANTTADIQVSVEYLVNGLRRQYALAGRKVAVIGISQGGLLPRFALTYWPDLRRKVSDVVAVAGTQHGTTLINCSAASPCEPARWQQARGSNLLRAINSQPDETPGRVSYTTVRTLTDETVQPQDGKRPTSSLDGARNVAIQDVCPERATTHIGAIVDSVTFAALNDAMAQPGREQAGAASVARFPPDVCAHPYGPGLNEAKTSLFLGLADAVVGASSGTVPAEPPVRPVFRRTR